MPETQRAGWIYLVATHTGTLCLFGGLRADGLATGGFLFTPLARGLRRQRAGAPPAFLLFLLGFGLKAGVFPLHFWLPPAHAAAPSHVSSFMSGHPHQDGDPGPGPAAVLVPDPPLLVGRACWWPWAPSRASSGSPSPWASTTSSGCWPTTPSRTSGSSCWAWASAPWARAPGIPALEALGYAGAPAPRAQPRPVQGPAVPGRRLGGARHRHPGPGAHGRPGQGHAVHRRRLPGRAPGPSAACRPSTASSASG